MEFTERTLRDNRAILAALEEGKEAGAAKALTRHLEWSRRHKEELLGRTESKAAAVVGR